MLHGVNLDIRPGEVIGIVGRSGSGKTVALRALEDLGYYCVDNLPVGSRTAKDMQGGSTMILNTLKAVVETGKPTLGTRIMYALFSKLGFILPKRTRAEHWPL